MKKILLLAFTALACASFGKGWLQPWTPKLPPWESRVYSCEYPKPYKLVAADDFKIDFDMDVTTINWWGVVSGRDQLFRPYHITIYKESNCMPAWDSVIWQGCVKPRDVALVGDDCLGNKVWKFFSNIPAGTVVLGPGHYWIQIAEDDLDSSKPDAPDFWWSSHQKFEVCPALQRDSSGLVFQPLKDPCNKEIDDLAFEIW
jgi:hypothetical protein